MRVPRKVTKIMSFLANQKTKWFSTKNEPKIYHARWSVPKCRADHFCVKSLHRFAKLTAIFTVFLFLLWAVIRQKQREIKGFCAVFVYLVMLDKW